MVLSTHYQRLRNEQSKSRNKNKLSQFPRTDGTNNPYNIFLDKRFYCGDKDKLTKDTCCFNHIVGLPVHEHTKQPNPLWDYEADLFQKLKKHKRLWILKATGLGITEFFLRLMLWLCVRNNNYRYQQFCIVVGPNLDLAKKLIRRMVNILSSVIPPETLETKTAYEIHVNDVYIQAFPSNNIDSYRGIDVPRFILLDEADFFKKNNEDEVRKVTERNIGKSDPYIVMVSTPNQPGGLMHRIEQEPDAICLYNKTKLHWTVGLDKVYTEASIAEAKKTTDFEQEYCVQFQGRIGDIFSPDIVKRSIELGDKYAHIPMNQFTWHFMGIDPGWSKVTPIYIGEIDKELKLVRIIHCELFDRSTPAIVAKRVHSLINEYMNIWCFIDGSDRGFINEIKVRRAESTSWSTTVTSEDRVSAQNSRIIPVNFATEHKPLLEKLHNYIATGRLAIPSNFERLHIALRTAKSKGKWDLDKDETSMDDDIDSLRLLLKGVSFDMINK